MTIKAVIISAQRCGGLFLAGCLSNHPDIHCPREEPFRRESIWQQRLKLGHAQLLDFVLSEPYYKVAACRLTYDQAFNPEIQGYLCENEVRIIHLTRMVMPTVTSTLLAKQEMAQGVPRHYFEDGFADDEMLDVAPAEVVKRIKHLLRQRALFQERYGGSHLNLQYENITKVGFMLPPDDTGRICEYLEIETARMTARNRKMHRRPWHEYYKNWKTVEHEIERSFPELVV